MPYFPLWLGSKRISPGLVRTLWIFLSSPFGLFSFCLQSVYSQICPGQESAKDIRKERSSQDFSTFLCVQLSRLWYSDQQHAAFSKETWAIPVHLLYSDVTCWRRHAFVAVQANFRAPCPHPHTYLSCSKKVSVSPLKILPSGQCWWLWIWPSHVSFPLLIPLLDKPSFLVINW